MGHVFGEIKAPYYIEFKRNCSNISVACDSVYNTVFTKKVQVQELFDTISIDIIIKGRSNNIWMMHL